MRKFTTVFLVVSMIVALGCSGGNEVREIPEASTTSAITEEEIEFDSSTDYMSLMIKAAANDDMVALSEAIEARNAKISEKGLSYELLTTDTFLATFERHAGFSLDVDYLEAMADCCVSGDSAAGKAAEEKRNKKIQALELNIPKVSYDELYLLSKIICSEAGSDWLSETWKMMVGEVLLNRVASPEFPNTLYECVYQKGQYSGVNSARFAEMLPNRASVDAAVKLLLGERAIKEPSVVFQSAFVQGGGVHTRLYDDHYGYTYLCYSNNKNLYE